MQLLPMLILRCPESNENHPQMGFELAGVSWSEFAAGTLRAQPREAFRICSFVGYLSKYL